MISTLVSWAGDECSETIGWRLKGNVSQYQPDIFQPFAGRYLLSALDSPISFLA
jgi:hypothetical protein